MKSEAKPTGTRKIGELPNKRERLCCHPEHLPPMFRVFEPGIYEHICPGCGKVCRFTVPQITFKFPVEEW